MKTVYTLPIISNYQQLDRVFSAKNIALAHSVKELIPESSEIRVERCALATIKTGVSKSPVLANSVITICVRYAARATRFEVYVDGLLVDYSTQRALMLKTFKYLMK